MFAQMDKYCFFFIIFGLLGFIFHTFIYCISLQYSCVKSPANKMPTKIKKFPLYLSSPSAKDMLRDIVTFTYLPQQLPQLTAAISSAMFFNRKSKTLLHKMPNTETLREMYIVFLFYCSAIYLNTQTSSKAKV